MAKTQKNVISFNQIEKVIKDNRIPKHIVKIGSDESFIEVEINPNISMTDYILMIDDIASNTFTYVDDKKIHIPSRFKVSLNSALIRYFTNIKSDSNASRIWELDLVTGISGKIKDVIGSLYDDIVEDSISTIDETIRFESSVSKSDELFDTIISLLNGFSKTVEKFDNTDVLSNIAGVLDKLTSVSGKDVVEAITSRANGTNTPDDMPSSISEIPVLSVVEDNKTENASSVAED